MISQRSKRILFLISDIILISAAIYLAFFLRFEGKILPQQFLNISGMIAFSLAISLPILYSYRLYSFSFEYVSTDDLISLAKATTLSFLFIGASIFILRDQKIFDGFPRSVFFISYFLVFLFLGAARFSKRIYLQIFQKEPGKEKRRILIVGAGDAGEQFLRNILSSKTSSYFPVGFVDGNSAKKGETIHGVRILGHINEIPQVSDKYEVEEMVIPLSSTGGAETKEAIELGRKAGLKRIKVIPSVPEIINGEFSLANIRDVQVEDLLRREPISLDAELIRDFILGKLILVTGAAGSIGSELCRQIVRFNPSTLLMLDQDESGIFNISEELKSKYTKLKIASIICDIQDKEKIGKIFDKFRPKVIFHAAAYKHVPLMEENPDEAVKNNIFGTKTVAEAAVRSGAEKFIFVSTDKAVNPISVMGMTKRIGEMVCQALNQRGDTRFISVRFGNILDSRGSVIPIFREQIKKGGPVEVTHPDMERYFMLIAESCLLVMEAGALGEGGEVFVLDMGKPIKILDLAKEMIKFSGLEPDKDIPIVFIGTRPGEKLFEEILTAEEGVVTTQYQKIFIAKLPKIDEGMLRFNLKKLKNEVQRLNKEGIKRVLKKITDLPKRR